MELVFPNGAGPGTPSRTSCRRASPLCRPSFYTMTCIISGCHTLDGDWETSVGSGGRIPSRTLDSNLALLQAPCCPHPAQGNLPSSYGGWTAHNQKRPRAHVDPIPALFFRAPHLPVLDRSTYPSPSRKRPGHLPREKQRLAGHSHLPSAPTTSGEPSLHLPTWPILRSGCKCWSTDAPGSSSPTLGCCLRLLGLP